MEVGSIRRGFNNPQLKVRALSSSDLVGRKARPRAPRKVPAGRRSRASPSSRWAGHVVHEDQGIGVIEALCRAKPSVSHVSTSLSSTRRRPALRADRAALKGPAIHRRKPDGPIKLRGKEWAAPASGTAVRREDGARPVAAYFERKSRPGHGVPLPTGSGRWNWRALSPYEETPDQARAVAEVKADMESAAVNGPVGVRDVRDTADRGGGPGGE